jgi:hypothetical protein
VVGGGEGSGIQAKTLGTAGGEVADDLLVKILLPCNSVGSIHEKTNAVDKDIRRCIV